MLKVVIVGYGEMFTNLIAGTLDAGCEIVGVLRKDTVKYSPVIRKIKDIFNPSIEYNYIKSYNLPEIYAPDGINSELFRKKLLKLNPDIMLIASWGERIKKETYNIPTIATINAHPSLLPKYRGPNPYFWVIKNQEQISGITLHLVDSGYDTGAILAQEEVKIYPSDTGYTLKQRTVLVARMLICELLKDLAEDVKIPLTQNEANMSYYSYPTGLELDFSKTAEKNLALINAAYNWTKTYFFHNLMPLCPSPHYTSIENNDSSYTLYGTIVKCDYKTKTISVLCADNKILKMSNINLYSKSDNFFKSNYIKKEIKEGYVIN